MAEIWAYVALEASETIATRLIDKIMIACEQLRHFPLAGTSRSYLARGLRVTFTGNYAIYYSHNEHELTIIRVLHGARDAAALAEHGAFDE